MEIVGGILVGLVILTLLAAVGVTTIVAFGLMGLMGLLTEMSFKRTFFLSFVMALAAPILLGAGAFAVLEDGSFERDLRDELGTVLPAIEGDPQAWREAVPRIRELRDDLRSGRIEPEEFERELEALIDETTGAQVDINGIEARETIVIESE